MAGAISETIDVNAGPAVAGLREFTDALEQAAAKYADLEAKMAKGLGGGASAAGADKMAAAMDKAAAAVEAAVDKINAAMEKVGGAADSAASGIERLDEAAGTAGASLDEAAAGADAAAAASDRLAESADAAGASLDRQAVSGKAAGDSADGAAASSAGFGSTAKLALLGVGVAAAYGLDKAMKFQSQMLLLNTQAGVSLPNVKKMSQGVLEISTQTGQSLSSVAESAYHVASNMESIGGTPVQMLNAVKIAAEGASVGHSNLVDTTNALTSVIASGIPGAKNYQQAMGAINATVGAGDMTMQDLSEAMATGVVPVVKGYGLTLKDTGAALATYGDLNIRGAKAGTELRMAVQALAVPAATGKTELASLGLTTSSLSKDMESGGLLKALDDLSGRFKANGIDAKNMGGVITDIFGKKAGAGLSLLMENLDRFQSKYPALTKGANDFGAAWEKTQQTPQQKWKELTAGLQASAAGFGTSLLPAFSAAVGFADRILADINGTKGAAAGLAGIFGGIAALFTAKKLVSGVESAVQTAEGGLRVAGKIGQTIGIPGSGGLANLGKGSATGAAAASGSLDRVAGAGDAAAAALDKVAGAGGVAAAGEDAAGAAGDKAALGEGAAGVGGKGGGAVGAIGTAAIGLIISKVIIDQLENKKNDKVLGNTNPNSWWNSYGAAFQSSAAGHVYDWTQDHPVQAPSRLPSKIPGVSMGTAAAASIPAPSLSSLDQAKAKVQADMTEINNDISTAKAAKLPAPDLSALDQAEAKVQASMNKINAAVNQAKASKIPSPDMSALDGAKAKAAQSAAGIRTEAQAPLDKPVKAASPDLSAYAQAKGRAAADGAAVDAGLASGISANAGQAVAAAQNVASQVEAAMKAALKVSSPSKVTQAIGTSAAQGLVVGLQGGTSAVNAAATALGKNVAKAADVTTINSTVSKLIGYAPSDTALTRLLKADNTKLVTLANQRAQLEAEITDSQQIAQQAISNASIMNAGSYTPADVTSGGPLAASATISGMQSMAADQKAFAQQIGQLKSMGLNATSLNQIVQSGASSGLPVAQGLTSGGKGAISQINQLEAQLHASAAKLGDEGAAPMYQAGVQAGQGLAQGIKASLGSVDAAMKALSTAMVADLKKDLKISSPSQVFAGFGLAIPQGLALGVDAGTPVAEAAVGRMGSRAAGAFHPGYAGGGGGQGGGGSGGGGSTVINVTVQGSVTTENDLLTKLQGLQLKRANANWQGGWKLPGRAT